MTKRISLYITVCILAISPILHAQTRGDELMTYVKGVEGKSDEGRHEFIENELKKIGVPYQIQPFDTTIKDGNGEKKLHGNNIIARMGKGKKKIVVGAHCDAVPMAPGANDNGGGVAVILEMIKNLKHETFHHSVDFCFFDYEEAGLIGSAMYVEKRDTSYEHLAMINLDVEGTGEEVYVGAVEPGKNDALMTAVHVARDSTRYLYYESNLYPDSDQESFGTAGLQNISISIVSKGDGKKLSDWVKSGFAQFKNSEDMPNVLKVMHTPDDKSIYMSTDALEKSYNFTTITFLSLDRAE